VTGFGDQQSFIEAVELEQEVDVAEHGFGAVGAEGKSLAEGIFGFLKDPGVHGLRFWTVSGGATRVQAPGIDAANGAAQFREGLLGIVIMDELAVPGEAVEIVPD